MTVPSHVSYATVDAAWQAALAAEEAFDFESARDAYLAAVAQAPAARLADALWRCAAFAVERLGAADEVAVWLDDPRFGIAADCKGTGRQLASVLAAAAAAVGHPRSGELDAIVQPWGDAEATARVAQRWLDAGRAADAQRVLASASWPTGSAPARLLDDLRQAALSALQAAMQPVQAALDGGATDQAQRVLETLRAEWGGHAGWASWEGKVRTATEAARAAQQRSDSRRAAAEGDWDAAVRQAEAVAQGPHGRDGDRSWLREVQQGAQRQRVAAWAADAERATGDAALAALVALAAESARGELPFDRPHHPLYRPWQVVLAAHAASRQQPLSQRLAALPALLGLDQLGADGDLDDAAQWIARLPAEWLTLPVVRQQQQRLQAHRQLVLDAEVQALAEGVHVLIAEGDLDGAAAALADGARRHPQSTAALHEVRSALQAARQQASRIRQLRDAFEAALARGAWFHARHVCNELAALLPPVEVESLRAQVDAVAGTGLRGRAMPPGLQKLADQGALGCAVALGRLVIVQGDLWLTVRLDSMGLQPFALPQGWALQSDAAIRLEAVGERIVATGLSAGRLVVIDQVPGEPPQIQAAIDLPQALRGDDLLLGAAMEPGSAQYTLLSRHSQRGAATNWTQLDGQSLEVREHRRAQPSMMSLAAVQNLDRHALAVAQPRDRQGARGWALGLLDGSGKVVQSWRDEQIGEQVGAVRKAIAWPGHERIFASVACLDPFDGRTLHDVPSLVVIRGDRVVFASTELRRRFAPLERLAIDHPWTLDSVAGRLWFAALPIDGAEGRDALLLGVDARTLRADRPLALAGVARVLALQPVADGAVALCRGHEGQHTLVRVTTDHGVPQLTSHRLPL